MKTIVLLPAKNEAWILGSSLRNFSDFADHIIVADQNSTDGSLEIYKEFPKVQVITNNEVGHSNAVRWALLDEARKIEASGGLMVCLDADEMISPEYIKKIQSIAAENPKKTLGFSLPWIQLWKSTSEHRVDSVWKNSMKPAIFVDDGKIQYSKEITINDHTSRIPKVSEIIEMKDCPIIHFQYASWEQSQLKQAWYRCNELIAGKTPAKAINNKYKPSLDTLSVVTKPTNEEWFQSIPLEYKTIPIESDWRYKEILGWFDKYGIEFFEPLQIWHLKTLRKMFIEKKGRSPEPKVYHPLLVWANNIRNKLR